MGMNLQHQTDSSAASEIEYIPNLVREKQNAKRVAVDLWHQSTEPFALYTLLFDVIHRLDDRTAPL